MATTKKTSSRTAARTSRKPAARKAPATSARGQGKARETLSMRTAAPGLTVNDIETSLAFYRDVLGFAVKERWEDKGKLLGVEMAAGKVSFMLGQDDWKKGKNRVKGLGVRIYCTTDQDVDRIAARIKASGGTLAQEPRDEWGMRALAVEDPDGYKITIASELKQG